MYRSDIQFESELERLFAENVMKYLDDSAKLTSQVEVDTIRGKFRLDFVVQFKEEKCAFECDGKEFHNAFRDEWRDAMILGAGAVDAIYRLRGSDLVYHLEDCLYIISKWNPSIFSQRGLINLTTLASDEARYRHFDDDVNALVPYWKDSTGPEPIFIHVERRRRVVPDGKREFWQVEFDYATKCGGGHLDEIIQRFRKEMYRNKVRSAANSQKEDAHHGI